MKVKLFIIKCYFTFFPLPVSRLFGRIIWGARQIVKTEAEPWRNAECQNPLDYISMTDRAQVTCQLVNRYIDKDSRIVDVGCNIGRVANHLRIEGYLNIYGFDVMVEAAKLRDSVFPDLSRENFITADFWDWAEHESKFDVAVVVSAVLELIHPCINPFEVFRKKEIKHIVATICEDLHRYPRFYKRLAGRCGYELLHQQKVDTYCTAYVWVAK